MCCAGSTSGVRTMTDLELTEDEIATARKIFEGEIPGRSGCHFCAGIHDTVRGLPPQRQPCPRVRRITWHADGTVVEAEYWPRSEWLDDDTIFPHDVYGAEDIEGGG
jgi:hypothetical protein